jgi:hypothetical protein
MQPQSWPRRPNPRPVAGKMIVPFASTGNWTQDPTIARTTDRQSFFRPLVEYLVSVVISVAAFVVLSLCKRGLLVTLHQVSKFPGYFSRANEAEVQNEREFNSLVRLHYSCDPRCSTGVMRETPTYAVFLILHNIIIHYLFIYFINRCD